MFKGLLDKAPKAALVNRTSDGGVLYARPKVAPLDRLRCEKFAAGKMPPLKPLFVDGWPRALGVWLFGVSLILAAASAGAADKVVLQLRWDHQFQFAGYYTALWQGYYADAGIEVEIRSAVTPNKKVLSATAEVVEERADFGIGSADILVARDKGASLVVAATVFQKSGVALMAKESSGLTSPADLKRLRVLRTPGGLVDAEFQAMLRAAGVDPTSIRPHASQRGAGSRLMLQGEIDAFMGYAMGTRWGARERGQPLSILWPSSYGVDFYGDSLFTSERLANGNPDLVRRFVSASMKGWQYALEHSEEIADRISQEMPRTFSLRDFHGFNRFLIDEVRNLTLYPVVQLGHTRLGRWHSMHEKLRDAGVVIKVFDTAGLIFNPELRKRERARILQNVAISSAAVLLLFVVVFAGWTWTLRRRVRTVTRLMRESEERFRTVVQDQTELICRATPDGIVTFVNDAYCNYFDKTREEMIGQGYLPLVPEENRERLLQEIAKLNPENSTLTTQHRIIESDGNVRWQEWTARALFDTDGHVEQIQAVGRDITDQKTAENALRASEERFRTQYTLAPVMMHSINLEGRLLGVTDRWLQTLGYERDEVIGRKVTDLLTETDRQRALGKVLPQLFETGSVDDVPYQFVTKNGELIDVLLSAIMQRDANGKYERTLSVLIDVTEQKQAEEQLRQAQKMEAVGQLTGGVAHDFNNLLTVVLGNLEMLRDETRENDELKRFIKSAIHATERGAMLTERLLAFSRKQTLHPKGLDLNELVADILDLLQRTLGETIVIEAEAGDSLWPVLADPAQMESALLNLALNARDAMPNGGTLTIGAANIKIDDEYVAAHADVGLGEYVLLSVSDTGIGMTQEAVRHAFEPFFTTKEVGEGSGLGLSMVYGFAKQSGGHISIYSEEGHGTTVKLYLPRAKRVDLQAEPDVAPDVSGAREETILVVEDDPDVRTLAVALLGDLGYEVLEAGDGASAITAMKSRSRIDLLFTDVILAGGMSGPEIAEEAKRIHPAMRILFTSGYPSQAMIRRREFEQSADLLDKPFRKTDLARKVREALQKAV